MAMPLRRTTDPVIEPVSLTAMKNHLRVDIDDDNDLISSMIIAAREYCENITGLGFVNQQWTFALDYFPYLGSFDGAPSQPSTGPQGYFGWGWTTSIMNAQTLLLPRSPLVTLDSITYYDTSNLLQTLDSTLYTIDTLSDPARVIPLPGFVWPVTYFRPSSVIVQFTVGYQKTKTDVLTATVNAVPTVTLKSTEIISITSVVADGNPVTDYSLVDQALVLPSSLSGQQVTVTYVVAAVPEPIKLAIKLLCSAYYENRSEFVQIEGSTSPLNSIPLGVNSLLAKYRQQRFGYTGSGH